MSEAGEWLVWYEGFSFNQVPGLFSGSAANRDCCKPAFSCHLEEESSLQLDPFSQKLSSAAVSVILTDT